MSELKRYRLTHTTHYMQALHEREEGEYCLFTDLEAERKAHEETKRHIELLVEAYNDCTHRLGKTRDAHAETNSRLEALEDAIASVISVSNGSFPVLQQAIQNSKDRNK